MPAEATVTAPATDTKSAGVQPPTTALTTEDLSSLSEDFANLDALDDDSPKPKPKAKPADKPDTKPDIKTDKSDVKPAVKADGSDLKPDKAQDTKQPDKAVNQPDKPVKAADLRTAYETLKRRVRDEFEPKLKEYETKLKEHESRPKQDDDIKLLQTRLEAAEKRRAELEDEIRYVNYQKSEEYVTKYDKPYKEAWTKAISALGELSVEDGDGNVRQATPQDMVTLANMPLGEAFKRARELFGDAASVVMQHREKIKDLADAQQKALDDAQKNGGERERVKALEAKAARDKTLALWGESNKTLADKYPKWFAPAEGDDEGNAMLAKGYKLVDKMFAASEENPGPQTPDEAVKLHALIRNKAAGFDRQVLMLKRANARISELETELSEFRRSEPHGGEKSGKSAASGNASDWGSEIEALDDRTLL